MALFENKVWSKFDTTLETQFHGFWSNLVKPYNYQKNMIFHKNGSFSHF
jgi:hypothetical protein